MAQVLPNILDRVQLRGARRKQDHGDVLRDPEGAGRVPAGSVEEQDGVSTAFNGAGDLVEVELHGVRVGEGERQGSAGTAGRADGAEQVGALVALVGGLTRAGPAPRPLPHEAVLLADAGLILEPDLDRFVPGQMGQMRPQGRGPVFLNASIVRSSCLG